VDGPGSVILFDCLSHCQLRPGQLKVSSLYTMASQAQDTRHGTITDTLHRVRKPVVDCPDGKRVVCNRNGIVKNNSLTANDRHAECYVGEDLVECCRV
jgi:hypothetical protein